MVETIRRLVVLSCIHWSLDIPDSFTEFIHLRAIFDKPEVLGLESQVFLYGTCRTIGSKRPEITSFPKLLPNTQLTNLNHSVVCSVPRPGWPDRIPNKKTPAHVWMPQNRNAPRNVSRRPWREEDVGGEKPQIYSEWRQKPKISKILKLGFHTF